MFASVLGTHTVVKTFTFHRAVTELSVRNLRWTQIHAPQKQTQTNKQTDTLFAHGVVCPQEVLFSQKIVERANEN